MSGNLKENLQGSEKSSAERANFHLMQFLSYAEALIPIERRELVEKYFGVKEIEATNYTVKEIIKAVKKHNG